MMRFFNLLNSELSMSLIFFLLHQLQHKNCAMESKVRIQKIDLKLIGFTFYCFYIPLCFFSFWNDVNVFLTKKKLFSSYFLFCGLRTKQYSTYKKYTEEKKRIILNFKYYVKCKMHLRWRYVREKMFITLPLNGATLKNGFGSNEKPKISRVNVEFGSIHGKK